MCCSGGSPDEQKCYMDITAAFEFLTQRMGIPVESIIWYALNRPLFSAHSILPRHVALVDHSAVVLPVSWLGGSLNLVG